MLKEQNVSLGELMVKITLLRENYLCFSPEIFLWKTFFFFWLISYHGRKFKYSVNHGLSSSGQPVSKIESYTADSIVIIDKLFLLVIRPG